MINYWDSMKITKKATIKTPRLIIKPIASKDEDRLMDILINEEIAKTFMLPEFKNREDSRKLAQKIITNSDINNHEHLEYGIYLDDVLIGTINDVEFNDEEIEVGYLIHPDYQGKGYATENLKAVINEIGQMGFKRLTAGYFIENKASQRVMEKAGMTKTDIKEEIQYRGISHNCEYYEYRY